MKIAIIIPYFGKLPNYFPLFLKSVEYNSNIDFIFYTDQKINSSSSNIIVNQMTFKELNLRIKENFDFPIALDTPYKLCDFKPAYGEIFHDDLVDYDFWGHCDVDMIFGDIGTFINEDILRNFDKIYEYGHLCLYRNDFNVNSLYRNTDVIDYKKVYQNKGSWCFDEKYGIQKIFDYHEMKTYKKLDMLDISPQHFRLQRVLDGEVKNYKYQIFTYEKGHIYLVYKNLTEELVLKKEFLYIHLQKRPMSIETDDMECYVITSNSFEKKEFGEEVTKEDFLKYDKKSLLKELQFFIKNQRYQFSRRIHKYLNF
jgi:hypothetical protein